MQNYNEQEIGDDVETQLSIIVTIVGGKVVLARCLDELTKQVDFAVAEIIVPYDNFSKDAAELEIDFPDVLFVFIENLGLAASKNIASRAHRLYDRRRSVGLDIAKGKIIAITEDHAVPSSDWCAKILELHGQPYGVIGGAIENGIDKPINWAWYYCDFGRYGRPLAKGEPEFVSDTNVAYKRDAIMSVRDIWSPSYHETTVHWALRANGAGLKIADGLLNFQMRPPMAFSNALRERTEWGRVFAETRSREISVGKRMLYAAGAIVLPPVLFLRVLRYMQRHRRTPRQVITASPILFLLVIFWSLGEILGYLSRDPESGETV